MSGKPGPYELWREAESEFPNDQAGRRIRYIALMREHGHLRPTLPADGPWRTIREFFACDSSAVSGDGKDGDKT